MSYKIYDIEISDLEKIKSVYRNGIENGNDTIEKNQYNKVIFKENYNTKLVSSETFFCDLRNVELISLIKKYVKINDATEYISNLVYINYKTGEEAKEHRDTNASYRTIIILLNDNFEGGKFYLDGKHIDFKCGHILEFNGELLHKVTPIENGNREVIAVWILPNQKSKKTFI